MMDAVKQVFKNKLSARQEGSLTLPMPTPPSRSYKSSCELHTAFWYEWFGRKIKGEEVCPTSQVTEGASSTK